MWMAGTKGAWPQEQESHLPGPLTSVNTLPCQILVSVERRKALKLYKEP